MRGRLFILAMAAAMALGTGSAWANVQVNVDVGSQTMNVYVAGEHYYSWHVSTGRRGYMTPSGTYRAKRLERKWYSTIYDGAPMPYAVFFRGGYAIHGTYDMKNLGRRASHGCVRLAPANAATLFNLVSRYGLRNTRITIHH
ncbi:MAG: L,D-transpeptidase [Hyphomicrobium sp.]|nr:L,D-transpeptidase [Hyphomicrobium sp.]